MVVSHLTWILDLRMSHVSSSITRHLDVARKENDGPVQNRLACSCFVIIQDARVLGVVEIPVMCLKLYFHFYPNISINIGLCLLHM